MAWNCSGVASRESVLTVSSRRLDSMRPLGSSTFCRVIACSTSATVSCRAASACRSSQIRIAKRRSPEMKTDATPGTIDSRSTR